MNYYGGKELAESFRTVRNNTVQIAKDIPEEEYSYRAAPETRSVAEMLAHIALTPAITRQYHGEDRVKTLAGIDFPAVLQRMHAEEKAPRTKAQIIELLNKTGEHYAVWVEGLPEDFLGEVFDMPPGATPATKTRFDAILGVKEHEMHHRGQLMLIERQIGIVPHLTRRIQERTNTSAAAKR